ncbi:hypothetical protein ABZ816_13250 [Actinosynnema sp. NPDC047251]|uniref:hypothetical protein n=1 Tax=Saccharothrix espanaensis TaxID=103731 RepID=UPI00031E48C8|nr:hypothetical protein [Saccharothrix espanaensis]
MKNARWAAGCAAALAVLLPGLAQAQDDTTSITGLVWFDRNENGVVDAGEPPLANGRAVRVFNAATKEFIGEFGTDGTGRYRADLPDVPLAIYNHNTDVYRATTTSSFFPEEAGGTFDFGIKGATVWGYSFWDVDGDGVKQDGERALPQPGTGRTYAVSGPVTLTADHPGPDGVQRVHDVPDGEFTFSPGTPGAAENLLLVDPTTGHDVPADRRITVAGGQDVRVDARYFEAVHDAAAGPLTVTPDGPARVGDLLEVVVPLENRGTVPVRIGLAPVSRLAVSGVVGAVPWQGVWRTADAVPAGGRVEVTVTVKLTEPLDEVRFRVVTEEPDADRANDESAAKVVVITPTTTPTTPPPATTTPTTTTAGTTTTSATAVVVPSPGGLAGTGASPGPFLLIGGLLVGGGGVAWFAARRRRA